MIQLNLRKKALYLILPIVLSSCIGTKSTAASSGQNDVIIHQLRVELEEIKHHIHTTVMQMNVLTNKMVNSEDTMFELKQRELITQKQTLKSNTEQLARLEKKVDELIENEKKQVAISETLEDEIKVHSRALHQNKKKLHEIEKQAIALKTHAQEISE
ncbi:MAG: hypothetical protein SP4CHLAM5_06860 [Chlamydiia bacterium]|nr:hypothetical protein [Chlamydiia bacterium]MCH9618553.1 hypothetical protein [Chlamydiia bacterium]MCH9624261.1 hypothetical protein [Chlamydiia bacterium]